MPRVFKRAPARRDLVEHYVYLAENAGEAIADRFLAGAEATFATLSEHPEMGAALVGGASKMAHPGVRKFPGLLLAAHQRCVYRSRPVRRARLVAIVWRQWAVIEQPRAEAPWR